MDARRSFAALVTLAVGAETAAAVLAVRAGLAEAPCHLPDLSTTDASAPSCAAASPFVGHQTWILALIVIAVIIVTVLLAAVELGRHLHRLSRIRRILGIGDASRSRRARLGGHEVTVVDKDALVCLCIGLWRPVIVVSSAALGALSPGELEAVLAHEERHRRGLDPLRLLAGLVATRALFFLPVLRQLHRGARLSMEVKADDAAAHEAGLTPLLGALHTFVRDRQPAPAMEGTTAIAGAGLIDQRIAVMEGSCPRTPLTVLRAVLSAACLGLLLTAAALVPSGIAAPRPLPFHRVPFHEVGRAVPLPVPWGSAPSTSSSR